MPNRLAEETSPYLLQHADNPVDWYPWGAEAFDAAKASGKPVLLSIGYSACHWCHVMAHESFEDDATAELMNKLFVNIKVDREERPDIDRIYQTAHQLLTQRGGGWPLTMFLSADDQKPFFGGTYFPKDRKYGMPSFGELLTNVAAYYGDKRSEIVEQGQRLTEVFEKLEPAAAADSDTLNANPIADVREQLAQSFDDATGTKSLLDGSVAHARSEAEISQRIRVSGILFRRAGERCAQSETTIAHVREDVELFACVEVSECEIRLDVARHTSRVGEWMAGPSTSTSK